MSKESREAGLGRTFFGHAEERRMAKPEAAPRRGRFVPEARDRARLLPRLREAARR